MRRQDFEKLVARSAYRPTDAAAVLVHLERQLAYEAQRRSDGLADLAVALVPALHGAVEEALPELERVARANRSQPLCQLYLFAAQLETGEQEHADDALAAWQLADPSDPMAELLATTRAGQPIPATSEDTRLANLAKFASTPLLSNPYRLAVDCMFEAIHERETTRVLDVGVGSGAQMAALLDLLTVRSHSVRRIEILGLDLVPRFLDTAGKTIRARAGQLTGSVQVAYRPILGRVESLDQATFEGIQADGPLDVVNATIALHEVAGEAKVDALQALRRFAPRHLVIAEWNYCLENTLAQTTVEFFFNIRRFLTDMVDALHTAHSHSEARAVAKDWMSMAAGQLTCPAAQRQECFLDASTWTKLLDHAGFLVASARELSEPIAVIQATPSPDLGLPPRALAQEAASTMKGATT